MCDWSTRQRVQPQYLSLYTDSVDQSREAVCGGSPYVPAVERVELAELVAAHGGGRSESHHPGVTHVLAAPGAVGSVAFTAAVKAQPPVDILTPEWLR